jgi:hypothetical protein
MNRSTILAVLVSAVLLASLAAVPALAKKSDFNTITEGEVLYSTGHYLVDEPIPTGFDPYGYNYQGHLFKGSYVNVYLGGAGFPPYEGDDDAYLAENPNAENHWAWPYRDVRLVMKWNDAWLSNMDRDGDGKLDRPDDYIGSGAWETNHMWGEDEVDGELYQWNYFVKIVAAPEGATVVNGYWQTEDGTEIGAVEWGSFAVIQQIYNDSYTGDHGVEYLSPASAGFGFYK